MRSNAPWGIKVPSRMAAFSVIRGDQLKLISKMALSGLIFATSTSAYSEAFYAREMLQPVKSAIEEATGPKAGRWTVGDWSQWSSQCSATASRSRSVSCTVDGVTVEDSNCHSSKPTSSDVQPQYRGCTTLLQNAWMKPGLANWSVSGTYSLSSANDSLRKTLLWVDKGTSVSQTTLMPLEVGKTYRFKFYVLNDYRSGGVVATVTSQGVELARSNAIGTGAPALTFQGTGSQVTVNVTSINTRSVRLSEFDLVALD